MHSAFSEGVTLHPVFSPARTLAQDVRVVVSRGDAYLGQVDLMVVRDANTRGLWEAIAPSSCATACGEELEELLYLYRPESLVIVESFKKAQGLAAPGGWLSAQVAPVFKAETTVLHVAPGGTLVLVHPYPLDSFDDEAAIKLCGVYEREWGVGAAIPGGALRAKMLRPAASFDCSPQKKDAAYLGEGKWRQ